MELFVRIEGLTGPVTTPASRAGWFDAISFAWGLQGPDPREVGATRRHSPFKVVRLIDGASAALLDAFIRHGTLNVTCAADAPDGKGVLRPAATYTLKAANVVEVRLLAANGGADAVTEEVSFTYNSIEVQQDPSQAKFSDSFTATK